MIRLQGKDIYLAALERKDCKKICEENEYDFENPYGFNNQGFERIVATTLEINKPAQKMLEKLGFVLEGRERKAVYFKGEKFDKLNYGLLINEYRQQTKRLIRPAHYL